MFYQDVSWKAEKPEVSIAARYIAFYTASYNCRIYAMGNDLKYTYSVPAYSGKGNAFYLLLHCKYRYHLSIAARYGMVVYADKNTIGTGPNAIDGNIKSDAGFQAILKF